VLGFPFRALRALHDFPAGNGGGVGILKPKEQSNVENVRGELAKLALNFSEAPFATKRGFPPTLHQNEAFSDGCFGHYAISYSHLSEKKREQKAKARVK